MPLVWRTNCSLYPATTLAERRWRLGSHGVPNLSLVRGSFDGVEQIDERLEAGVAVRRGKFEVDGQAGQLTDTNIFRVEFPAAPKTGLGFNWGAKFTGCRPNGNFFENARVSQTARDQQP